VCTFQLILLLVAGLGQSAACAGGWLAAFLPCDRAEGPACEPLVLVIPAPPFLLAGQWYAWKFKQKCLSKSGVVLIKALTADQFSFTCFTWQFLGLLPRWAGQLGVWQGCSRTMHGRWAPSWDWASLCACCQLWASASVLVVLAVAEALLPYWGWGKRDLSVGFLAQEPCLSFAGQTPHCKPFPPPPRVVGMPAAQVRGFGPS